MIAVPLAQAVAASPNDYLAPIGLAVGVAAILSAAWRFRNWVRSQAREEQQTKAFEKRVGEIFAAGVRSDDFKRAVRDVVAEAFTGREEADRHFRRETLENQKEAITDAIGDLSNRLEGRFREVEAAQAARARETDARTTELIVKVELAVRDAKGYMARVAGEYAAIRKTIEDRDRAGLAKERVG